MKKAVARLFTPHAVVPKPHMFVMIGVQVVAALVFWVFSPLKMIPGPMEVFGRYGFLWFEKGLGQALKTSFLTTMEALIIGAILSLILSYLTVLPFFQPIAQAFSKGRFLGLTGLTLIFTLLTGGGHTLKLSIMVWGLSVFFVANVISVVASTTKAELDHARTLRMGRWRVVYEVIILGKLDQVLTALGQNVAITWMMLTMVEGLVRSEGGLGALLLIQEKHLELADIYAIQILILGTGLVIDWIFEAIKRGVCPHAQLGLERR